ncbi:sugar phosphate nucleotidyltransferase [Anoxybacillus flavithermus]|uniref:Nucleoside-diphosphate-sugar pyrophosphorylase fused to phosphomannomutase n=1 Tax=Anoxybacillus flavithermus AK1 TaxID=1297581 RepID=M8D8N7_9BACL|nr:sugar phosphate nucleotidyltransferase [Anoxybacillus flavithermus]EMT47146.1 nucleoside-diphosphate-sugar pyrophosphorylase fused to phosphomannomutase [Anoxybacillus flavithermus AK1]
MKAVIMAGGRGTRLRPLTCHVPKPLVPVMNKPVMEYSIEWLKRYGITNIAVTVQYLSDEIVRYFGDGRRFGVHLHYFEDDVPLGTAGSVKHAQSFLDDTFVVISADTMTTIDLQPALDFHFSKQAIATVLMYHEAIPLSYGGIVTDRHGKMIHFVEKPKWNEVCSDLVNTGIYICHPAIFDHMPEHPPYDFSQHVFPYLIQNGYPIYGWQADGYWSDIGVIEQYHQTHMDFMAHRFISPHYREIAPDVWVGERVDIAQQVKLEGPIVIGDDVCIDQHAVIGPYTVIGDGSFIGKHASLKRSIVWSDVYIDQHSELRGAIVANDVYIGKKNEIFDYAVIGAKCKLENKVKVQPLAKIWPNKTIAEKTRVKESIVWKERQMKTSFSEQGMKIRAADVQPSLIVQLASAYSNLYQRGSCILIGFDDHPLSKTIGMLFAQCLHMYGLDTNVYDGAYLPSFRYIIANRRYDGGIFITINEHDEVIIDIHDEYGYPVDRKVEQAIEQKIGYEQMSYVLTEQIGQSMKQKEDDHMYVRALQQLMSFSSLDPLKVVVCSSPLLRQVIERTLQSFPIEVIWTANGDDEHMKNEVEKTQAHFAVVFHHFGERFRVFDGRGVVLTNEEVISLHVLVSLLFSETKKVAVPSWAPSVLHTLAERLHGEMTYVKNTRRDLLLAHHEPFHFYFDGLYACIQLLHLLAIERCSLRAILSSIPTIHLSCRHVYCPWNERAAVMRKLLEDEGDKQVDFTDGMKVYHEDGAWTLILPKLDEPTLTIYSQAANAQKAKEYTKYYIKKIRQYQNV